MTTAFDPVVPPIGYPDLRQRAAWLELPRRTSLEVRGADAVAFVDRFCTAALGRLPAGAGAEACFCDASGRVLALTTVLRLADGVWIDADPEAAAVLPAHLEHHHIRERLVIEDVSAARVSLFVGGPRAADWLTARGLEPPAAALGHAVLTIDGAEVRAVRVDWCGAGGFLLQAAGDAGPTVAAWLDAGLPRAEAAAFATARIEQGTPTAADLDPRTLPQELGRDDRLISFTKGCYLGQETVARIDALGHVNRRLVAVTTDAPRDVPPGAVVTHAGEPVGVVTSGCRSPRLDAGLGLVLLHRRGSAADGALAIDGVAARVVPLPVAAPGPDPAGGELLLSTRRFDVVRVVEPCADGSWRPREVVRHPGSVVVLPLVSPDEVCLVEVHRVAVEGTLLELPAGTLDREESLAEAARRELGEETGYRAGRIAAAGSFWMSPGILRERMHLFVAEDLVAGPQALEPGERIRTRVVAWPEAVAMCLDGRIEDAKTIAALLRWDVIRRRAAAPG